MATTTTRTPKEHAELLEQAYRDAMLTVELFLKQGHETRLKRLCQQIEFVTRDKTALPYEYMDELDLELVLES